MAIDNDVIRTKGAAMASPRSSDPSHRHVLTCTRTKNPHQPRHSIVNQTYGQTRDSSHRRCHLHNHMSGPWLHHTSNNAVPTTTKRTHRHPHDDISTFHEIASCVRRQDPWCIVVATSPPPTWARIPLATPPLPSFQPPSPPPSPSFQPPRSPPPPPSPSFPPLH